VPKHGKKVYMRHVDKMLDFSRVQVEPEEEEKKERS